MQLTTFQIEGDRVRAGYECPCGCTPAVSYQRGGDVVEEGCCCGNHFAVGRDAASRLAPREGFRLETIGLSVPWMETLQAAWLIGPSAHPEAAGHHGDDHSAPSM